MLAGTMRFWLVPRGSGSEFFIFWEAVGCAFPQILADFGSLLDADVAVEYIRLRNVTSFYLRMVYSSHALREAVADFAVIMQVL